jgi:hypothetical protein
VTSTSKKEKVVDQEAAAAEAALEEATREVEPAREEAEEQLEAQAVAAIVNEAVAEAVAVAAAEEVQAQELPSRELRDQTVQLVEPVADLAVQMEDQGTKEVEVADLEIVPLEVVRDKIEEAVESIEILQDRKSQ